MDRILAIGLLSLGAVGVVVLALQLFAVVRHLGAAEPCAPGRVPISILKPLRGIDDDLLENLERFVRLAYPAYEVLLGVKDVSDPAWPVACAFARRHPERVRVILQRGEAGMNPKVNQLVGLARSARHDLLVVSDSNVRVDDGYLEGVAARLADPQVGLVTHPVVGVGERRLGSLLDNLHLLATIGPGVVAAKRLAGEDVVVGKSMALRRADLVALGGFESVKDVLAEDYVMGRRVVAELGKRVALGRPVANVSRDKAVRDFVDRYRRWAVIHRQSVSLPVYLGEALLQPACFALAAATLAPALAGVAAALVVAEVVLVAATARCLRPGGMPLASLLAVPLKDVLVGAAWVHGLLTRRVEWRGHLLEVLEGTRLRRPAEPPREAREVA